MSAVDAAPDDTDVTRCGTIDPREGASGCPCLLDQGHEGRHKIGLRDSGWLDDSPAGRRRLVWDHAGFRPKRRKGHRSV